MGKRISWTFGITLTLMVALVLACTPQVKTTVQSSGPTIEQAITYHGPRARIAVASFRCKAAKCNGEIGDGVADMLSTALFRTGKFVVLERGAGLKSIQEELNLGQSGYVRQGASPQMGLMEGADVLVIGAITAFEPNASGIGGGGIAIPLNLPVVGGLRVGKKEAYIAADIRLVDVATGRIINATEVEGKTSSWKLGGLGGGIMGNMALGGGLGAYKNTPMEKAVRVMLDNAVDAIAKMTPESYYRYSAKGQLLGTAGAAAGLKPGPATGTIIGGGQRFVPGDKVIFSETFSSYAIGDIPTSMKIKKGQVEVASFHGKKWLRALNSDVHVFKKIALPKDFAVEWKVYLNIDTWDVDLYNALYLGEEESPDRFEYCGNNGGEYPTWSGIRLKTVPRLKVGIIHHIAIQQLKGMINVFVDGKRAYHAPLNEGIIGGSLPNRYGITMVLKGANPARNYNVLVTDIKVTQYTGSIKK